MAENVKGQGTDRNRESLKENLSSKTQSGSQERTGQDTRTSGDEAPTRVASRNLHSKSSVTGSDTDGQATAE
jgi:hypothetical protein